MNSGPVVVPSPENFLYMWLCLGFRIERVTAHRVAISASSGHIGILLFKAFQARD